MSQLIEEYTSTVTNLLTTIAREETPTILKAADLLSDNVVEGRFIKPIHDKCRRRIHHLYPVW